MILSCSDIFCKACWSSCLIFTFSFSLSWICKICSWVSCSICLFLLLKKSISFDCWTSRAVLLSSFICRNFSWNWGFINNILQSCCSMISSASWIAIVCIVHKYEYRLKPGLFSVTSKIKLERSAKYFWTSWSRFDDFSQYNQTFLSIRDKYTAILPSCLFNSKFLGQRRIAVSTIGFIGTNFVSSIRPVSLSEILRSMSDAKYWDAIDELEDFFSKSFNELLTSKGKFGIEKTHFADDDEITVSS